MKSSDIIIPPLPEFNDNSPQIVLTLDNIRSEMERNNEDLFEFLWFAREYPRFYRHHIHNIEYRIQTIHKLYERHRKEFTLTKRFEGYEEPDEMSISSILSSRIYWDFEALLGATSSALDILARIAGIAYEGQNPLSLHRLSKKKELTGIVDLFRQAQLDWVNGMKDYRDCFVHFNPVDNRVYVTIYKSNEKWKMWCKIPTNPKIRVQHQFVFSRKTDLLRYAVSIHKNLSKLDSQVTKQIQELYLKGEFPKRTRNLFYLGSQDGN